MVHGPEPERAGCRTLLGGIDFFPLPLRQQVGNGLPGRSSDLLLQKVLIEQQGEVEPVGCDGQK